MQENYTFSKELKIRKSGQYKDVFTSGRRYYNRFMRLHIKIDEIGLKQCGVVISRKIKGSVIRNHYKRLVREYFRLNQFKLKDGIRLVVFVSSKFQPAKYELVEKELTFLLKKAGMLH